MKVFLKEGKEKEKHNHKRLLHTKIVSGLWQKGVV